MQSAELAEAIEWIEARGAKDSQSHASNLPT
jgi:hypothetical protein